MLSYAGCMIENYDLAFFLSSTNMVDNKTLQNLQFGMVLAKSNEKRIALISGSIAAVVFCLANLVLFGYVFEDPNFAEMVVSIGIVIAATIVSYRICYEEILRYENNR